VSRAIPSEELQNIRDTDAAAGSDLQCAPIAWGQRRRLLQAHDDLEEVLDDHDRLTKDLARLVGMDAAAPKLCDVVSWVHALREPAVSPTPVTCAHGYKVSELADGTVSCDCGCTVVLSV
jgi:hypothetical protein